MARLFNDAALEFFRNATVIGGTVPFSFGCWFFDDDMTRSATLFSINDASDSSHQFALMVDGGGAVNDDALLCLARDADNTIGSGASAVSVGNVLVNTWHHGLGVWAASNDRRVYLDGVRGTDGTASRAPANQDRTAIGRFDDLTPNWEWSGRIAEAVVWDVALTDAEAAALARGVSPRRMRPSNILAYWPLPAFTGDAQDFSSNQKVMTDNATVGVADHAPVGLITPPWAATMPLIKVVVAVVVPYQPWLQRAPILAQ